MKIMVGYDKSNASKEAVKYAKNHAVAFNAKIYIVTSVAQSRELGMEDIQIKGELPGGCGETAKIGLKPIPENLQN